MSELLVPAQQPVEEEEEEEDALFIAFLFHSKRLLKSANEPLLRVTHVSHSAQTPTPRSPALTLPNLSTAAGIN